jgi:hypothetical protein
MAEHPRELSEQTKKKYELAIARLEKAKLDLLKPKPVLAWIREQGGESAQKVYLSAIKWKVGAKDYPIEYQDAMKVFFTNQVAHEKKQVLSERQVSNFVEYPDLLKVQRNLAKKDKSDKDWERYLIASLYTLNAPLRADYGDVKVYGREDKRRSTGNELIWRKKKPVFIMREYKTSKAHGAVKIAVSKELAKVIGEWFNHLGATPTYLLGADSITPNALLVKIADAFAETGKQVGIDILRHSYIVYYYPSLKSIEQKEELAGRMLHTKERQELYNSQNV